MSTIMLINYNIVQFFVPCTSEQFFLLLLSSLHIKRISHDTQRHKNKEPPNLLDLLSLFLWPLFLLFVSGGALYEIYHSKYLTTAFCLLLSSVMFVHMLNGLTANDYISNVFYFNSLAICWKRNATHRIVCCRNWVCRTYTGILSTFFRLRFQFGLYTIFILARKPVFKRNEIAQTETNQSN